jgi:hypothetical protein
MGVLLSMSLRVMSEMRGTVRRADVRRTAGMAGRASVEEQRHHGTAACSDGILRTDPKYGWGRRPPVVTTVTAGPASREIA